MLLVMKLPLLPTNTTMLKLRQMDQGTALDRTEIGPTNEICPVIPWVLGSIQIL